MLARSPTDMQISCERGCRRPHQLTFYSVLAEGSTHSEPALVDWLRVEFGVERAGEALLTPHVLSFDEFAAEVRRVRSGPTHPRGGLVQHLAR
jgi:hypothetical protein